MQSLQGMHDTVKLWTLHTLTQHNDSVLLSPLKMSQGCVTMSKKKKATLAYVQINWSRPWWTTMAGLRPNWA